MSGSLIPLWIIGAPLIIGIIEWMRTPAPRMIGTTGITRDPRPELREPAIMPR